MEKHQNATKQLELTGHWLAGRVVVEPRLVLFAFGLVRHWLMRSHARVACVLLSCLLS